MSKKLKQFSNQIDGFPPFKTVKYTIKEFIEEAIHTVDLQPEEIQRNFVADRDWINSLMTSVMLGVSMGKFTWYAIEEPYYKTEFGVKKLCIMGNADSYQRSSGVYSFVEDGNYSFLNDLVGVYKLMDRAGNIILNDGTKVNLGGLTSAEIFKQDGLKKKLFDYEIEVDIYGGKDSWFCNKVQITYLFKNALNGGNYLNGQEKRNPNVFENAKLIRNISRLKPHPLFEFQEKKDSYFSFGNLRMDYDENVARFCLLLIYGEEKALSKTELDNFYDDITYMDSLKTPNGNLKKLLESRLDLMYHLLKDKKHKDIMATGVLLCLFIFTDIYIKYGKHPKFNYSNLSSLFFECHIFLTNDFEKNKDTTRSIYTDCYSNKGNSSKVKILYDLIREYLKNNKGFSEKYVKYNNEKRLFTNTQKLEMLINQNYKCACCGDPIDLSTIQGDHSIIPFTEGGKTDVNENGIGLCETCNKMKGRKHPREFIKYVEKSVKNKQIPKTKLLHYEKIIGNKENYLELIQEKQYFNLKK